VSPGLRLTGDEKAALTKNGQRDATADSTSKRQTLKKTQAAETRNNASYFIL